MAAILRSSPTACVVVHHDARTTQPPEVPDERVLVTTHRRSADWGSWEIVAATIDALRVARDTFDPALVVLVSGQDYPARDLAEWEAQFLTEGRAWAGTARPLSYRAKWGRPHGRGDDDLTRYTYRWYRLPFSRFLAGDSGAARRIRWPLWKLGHYLEPLVDVRSVTRGRGMHVGLRARRPPFDEMVPCYKGSQWWAMDRRLVDAVLEQVVDNRRLVATYRRSVIPDESFFQSAVAPLHDPSLGEPVTHVDWLVEADAPKVLEMADLDDVLASGCPFCRKVEAGISDALMDRLDEMSGGTAAEQGLLQGG